MRLARRKYARTTSKGGQPRGFLYMRASFRGGLIEKLKLKLPHARAGGLVRRGEAATLDELKEEKKGWAVATGLFRVFGEELIGKYRKGPKY